MTSPADPRGMDKVFCHLPWTHLCAHLDGVYARCCVDSTGQNSTRFQELRKPGRLGLDAEVIGCAPGSVFAADNPDLVTSVAEAFNGPAMRRTRLAMLAGEPVAACRDCYQREELTGDSYRLQMTRQERPAPTAAECGAMTGPDGSVDRFPDFLDLRLGNHCNLRCVMCDVPTSSSIVTASRGRTWLRESLDPYSEDAGFWRCLTENLGSISSLYLAGGEPMLLKAHQRLLRLFVESGRAGEVDLTYATNLTVLPAAVLALWRQFRLVSLEASCDGTGEVFERIRVGASWTVFERNADQVKDLVRLSVHASPQRDNILQLGDIIAWAVDRGLAVHVSNVVREPAELSVRNLPAPRKEQASAYLADLAADLDRSGHYLAATDVRGVRRYLLAPATLPDGRPSSAE